MKNKKQKIDYSNLFYAYEIVHRSNDKRHYFIHRFLSEQEREKWIIDGIAAQNHLRLDPVFRNKVECNDPMIQFAIEHKFWPIKVEYYPDGTYSLIGDVSDGLHGADHAVLQK